jgi:hypothetical protein
MNSIRTTQTNASRHRIRRQAWRQPMYTSVWVALLLEIQHLSRRRGAIIERRRTRGD